MKIEFYCPRWGSEEIEWSKFCQKVKAAGYDGVEAPVSEDAQERAIMLEALQQNDLLLIAQYYQSFEKDFQKHKESYIHHLRLMASVQPVKINAQTGKDYFDFKQNAELFAIADGIAKETGIMISHETHRNKALFAAHIAQEFLLKIPGLMITADFSHWCNVAESLLEDQEEALALACERVAHLHARVGHSQGAQVIDPRLPEVKRELEAHLAWWDTIVANKRLEKVAKLTICSEFGPAPYMMHLPFTQMPMANQWDINVFMMGLLKDRYQV